MIESSIHLQDERCSYESVAEEDAVRWWGQIA